MLVIPEKILKNHVNPFHLLQAEFKTGVSAASPMRKINFFKVKAELFPSNLVEAQRNEKLEPNYDHRQISPISLAVIFLFFVLFQTDERVQPVTRRHFHSLLLLQETLGNEYLHNFGSFWGATMA